MHAQVWEVDQGTGGGLKEGWEGEEDNPELQK